MPDKFCTLDQVRTLAKISAGFATNDGLFNAMIPVVTAQIRQYCKRDFDKKQRTQVFDSYRNLGTFPMQTLYLDEKPVDLSLLHEARVNLARDFANTVKLIETAGTTNQVEFEGPAGRVRIKIQTIKHQRAIEVIYTGGFVRDGGDNDLILVPEPIAQGCALQVGFIVERITANEAGQTEDGADGENAGINDASQVGLLPEVKAMIESERRILTGRRS